MSETQVVEHRLTSLEKQTEKHEEHLKSHDRGFERMDGKIEEIIKILSSRPTWFVAILIAVLTTVTSSLIVYVATHH